ncbi:UNVERIFIED_CONTAM: Malonyl-coenzyme:anthocyanin 5-O-glucoside-6'''-O-malonyltransferase [Sesamum calycinum]|uniref:Malonyl-coenzyme:anthocyanin 5-O-glucoside-6'''-O-malonyltransferase n=1 Tax=Sesamum calycinum TaxID=2727403 RepID=A0AAW2SZS9_9LAMI
MATTSKRVTVHECCGVAPLAAAGEAAEQSLPLTFFDMIWLYFHPIQRLLFYPSTCSTTDFLETIVPNLKKSLSQTLRNYLPLAGNLIHPMNSDMPEFRYVPGDSVSVTFAEATEDLDFDYFTGNQARDSDEFYALAPDLPEPKTDSESGFKIIPVLAIQVTLFPGTGICIDTQEFGVGWRTRSYSLIILYGKTAYVWSCLAKSAAESGEEVDDNEPEYFGFTVDARHRMESPVPATYFGNCVAFVVVESTHGLLRGRDGFVSAVKSVGQLITNKANNKEEILRDADNWLVKYWPLLGKRLFGVAGSPKFDLYDTDFGWGRPKKYESVSIDRGGSISLCKSREFEGGLEIGVSLPRKKMDAFAAIFVDGLKT